MSARDVLGRQICAMLQAGPASLATVHQRLRDRGCIGPTITVRPVKRTLADLVTKRALVRVDTHDSNPPTFRLSTASRPPARATPSASRPPARAAPSAGAPGDTGLGPKLDALARRIARIQVELAAVAQAVDSLRTDT